MSRCREDELGSGFSCSCLMDRWKQLLTERGTGGKNREIKQGHRAQKYISVVIHRETSRQSDESPGVGWFPKSGQTPTFPSLGLRVLRGQQWGWSGEGSCDAPRRHYKTSAAIYRPCRPQRALGLAVPPSLPPSLSLPGFSWGGGRAEEQGKGRKAAVCPSVALLSTAGFLPLRY